MTDTHSLAEVIALRKELRTVLDREWRLSADLDAERAAHKQATKRYGKAIRDFIRASTENHGLKARVEGLELVVDGYRRHRETCGKEECPAPGSEGAAWVRLWGERERGLRDGGVPGGTQGYRRGFAELEARLAGEDSEGSPDSRADTRFARLICFGRRVTEALWNMGGRP